MNLETANYIVTYFDHLLTSDERSAITYQYFLTEGIDQYKIKAASRILADNPNEIYFNNCPKCGKTYTQTTVKSM